MKTIQHAIVLVFLFGVASAQALPITYSATQSGFQSSAGGSNAGGSTEYLVGTSNFLGQEFRSFFTFDFLGRPADSVVNSGVLRLDKNSGCNCGNLTLWSLEGPLSQWLNAAPPATGFTDLGDGAALGSASLVTPNSLIINSPPSIDIPLNAIALTSINQAFRSASGWGVGATSDGLLEMIATSAGGARLVLDVQPEPIVAPVPAPGSLALLLLGGLAMTGARGMRVLSESR